MRLVKGEEVFSSNGEKLGTLDRVIIDPVTKTVTHLVVAKGFLFTSNKVITIDGFESEGDTITLKPTDLSWDQFPEFEETHYVSLSDGEYPTADAQAAQASILYPPVNVAGWRADTPTGDFPAVPGPGYIEQTKQNIPEGNVALKEGTKVVTPDGTHVGSVAEVVMNPEDSRATHFVIKEGVLFTHRKLIPVMWISGITEDQVTLAVSSGTLANLPEYKLPER